MQRPLLEPRSREAARSPLCLPPHIGSEFIWARGRAISRLDLEAYLRSPQWLARRRRWLEEWTRHTSAAPACRVCGRRWRISDGDLHLLSYRDLGAEHFDDLLPLCRPHHQALHRLYDDSTAWRELGLRQGSWGIVASLGGWHGR